MRRATTSSGTARSPSRPPGTRPHSSTPASRRGRGTPTRSAPATRRGARPPRRPAPRPPSSRRSKTRIRASAAATSSLPTRGPPTAPSAANQTAWNQDVSKAPVDPRSSQYLAKIRSLGGNQFIHPDFGSNPTYGIPYVVVPGVQPRVPTQFTLYGDESDPGPYPIPPHAPIEAGSDHHVLVVDRDHCNLYETDGSRYVGGTRNSWKAWGGALFNLNRAGPLRPDSWTSADAAGLPIFPGSSATTRSRRVTSTMRSGSRSTRRSARSSIPPRTTRPTAATPTCRRWACACG